MTSSIYQRIGYLVLTLSVWALSLSAIAEDSAATTKQAEQTDQTDQTIWQQLASLRFLTDTKIPFNETSKTRLQRKPKNQSGYLWISDAGDFVMRINGPREEERRLAGTQLSLTRNGKTRSTQLNPSRGAHQLLLAVVDLMEGNTERLRQNFAVQTSKPVLENTSSENTSLEKTEETTPATAATWSWSLTPIDEAMRRELSRLRLQGRDNRLTSLRAERGRSWQQIEFSGRKLPQP